MLAFFMPVCLEIIFQEKKEVLGDLLKKARMTTEILNRMEGVTCNEVMGAMYAFPQIQMPPKAIEAAKVSSAFLGDLN